MNMDRNLKIDEDLAYDIGAFDGDTVGMLNRLGYNKIVCFEPNPSAFSSMQHNFRNNQSITLINKAVSEHSGKKMNLIVIPAHPYLNSLETEWFSTHRHPSEGSHTVEVETISLDDYIESEGRIPAYIKVDAEGHEIPIFKSLHYKPNRLSFEWISEFYEKNETCLKMLADLGFENFKIGHGEEIPGENHTSFTFDECCSQMKMYNETDVERKIWGNIWCS